MFFVRGIGFVLLREQNLVWELLVLAGKVGPQELFFNVDLNGALLFPG